MKGISMPIRLENEQQVENAQQVDEQQPQSGGLLSRITGKGRKAGEDPPVTLPDGWVVSGQMGKFLGEHSAAKFLGADFRRMATKTAAGLTVEEVYDPRKHTPEHGWTKRMIKHEYARLELTGAPALGQIGGLPKTQIWWCKNGGVPVCIGARLAESILRRIGAVDDKESEEANEA
jgi:hypothetical protein